LGENICREHLTKDMYLECIPSQNAIINQAPVAHACNPTWEADIGRIEVLEASSGK
jgi:hypothetical protein